MHIVEQKAMKLPVFLVIWLFSYIALQIKISIILYITLKTKHCVVVTLEEDFSIVYFAIISVAEDVKRLFIKFCPSKTCIIGTIYE